MPRAKRTKRVAEYCAQLDTRWLAQEGFIAPDAQRSGTLTWAPIGAEEIDDVVRFAVFDSDTTATPPWFELTYCSIADDEPIKIRILLTARGRTSWYFLCPECDHRAQKLYRPFEVIHHLGVHAVREEKEFRCRACWNLTYLAQAESHTTPQWNARRARELEGVAKTPADQKRLERYRRNAAPRKRYVQPRRSPRVRIPEKVSLGELIALMGERRQIAVTGSCA